MADMTKMGSLGSYRAFYGYVFQWPSDSHLWSFDSITASPLHLTEVTVYYNFLRRAAQREPTLQEAQLYSRDPRKALYNLKCSTVVRITQTDRMITWGALSATATFYSATFIVNSFAYALFNYSASLVQLEFRRHFWHHKTRFHGLSYGVLCVIVGLAVFVERRLVTDGQTDGKTDRRTDTRWRQ